METESAKTTGAQGEAKTGKKEGSFMEMCMNRCGDKAKMEEMGKMMKNCCADKTKIKDMVKTMKDCGGDSSKMAGMGKMMKNCCK
jgi:hypothetical protein